MALLAYDPTRMQMVPVKQARVVAYVIDSDTGERYDTVASAEAAIAQRNQVLDTTFEGRRTATAQSLQQQAGQTAATGGMGAVGRGEYQPQPNVVVAEQPAAEQNVSAEDGTLLVDGKPFTGVKNGVQYVNGKAVSTTVISDNTVDNNVVPTPKKIIGYKTWTNPTTGATYKVPMYDDGTDDLADWTGGVGVPQSFMLYTPESGYSGYNYAGSNVQTSAADNTSAAAAAAAEKRMAERRSAFEDLYSEMSAIGLAALVEPLRGLIQQDVSPSEFTIKLRESEAYQKRFIANQERINKGLRALTPGEYIKVEDGYRQVLRQYGLSQFDNDQYVSQFIANDISAAEFNDRITLAVDRVKSADPVVTSTLRDYYGLNQQDLVAYILDPKQQLPALQRKVASAEIGAAARVQGLESGRLVAEQLAAQGVTKTEAETGYARIAGMLPSAEKLSQIYGASLEGYDLGQAEQEVFNKLASAQRRRERLVQREVAEFSGTSGLGKTSLTQQAGGQI